MLLPFMGLFMFFIPVAGFVAGIGLCCLRRFRRLAPFAFLMPMIASYVALVGFWAVGLGAEHFGFQGLPVALAAFVGLLSGGVLGLMLGAILALRILRTCRRLSRTRQENASP
jgi:hypothetical protein